MYSKNFVVVVRVNGRNLREFGSDGSECSVLLPFGTEYSISAKNLESRSARMRISIDGEDVLSKNWIIVPAGKEISVDGFMNSSGRVTNKFRFIQKTEHIIDHRGDRIDDGFILIQWQFEKPKPVTVDVYENHHHNHWDHVHHYPKPYWPSNPWGGPWITYGSGTARGFSGDVQVTNCVNSTGTSKDVPFTNTCHVDMPMASAGPLPEEGITVHGREIDQQYHTGYIGQLEPNKHTMIIRLKGTAKVAGEKVIAPVEVKSKVQCPTCGIMAKSGMRYCSNCGTCLVEI